jgi:hypothetical protein
MVGSHIVRRQTAGKIKKKIKNVSGCYRCVE